MPPPSYPSGRQYLSRLLDSNGDGTGTKNIILDYRDPADGIGETDYFIQPPAGEIFLITRLLVHIRDGGSFDAEKYGNGVTLTTGIVITLKRGAAVEVDLTDGVPIKSNAQWAQLCYDVAISTYGAGDEYLHARWSFFKGGVPGLYLHGDDEDKFVVTVNDKLDTLDEHSFTVQGHNVSRNQHGELIR